MNKEKLLAIADLLERTPDEAVNMSSWKNTACGTTHCAIGHAVAAGIVTSVELRPAGERRWGLYGLDGQLGEDAVTDELGLTICEFDELFGHFAMLLTKREAVDRIRTTVARSEQ